MLDGSKRSEAEPQVVQIHLHCTFWRLRRTRTCLLVSGGKLGKSQRAGPTTVCGKLPFSQIGVLAGRIVRQPRGFSPTAVPAMIYC
jgi:hypothetical protein